MYQAFSLTLLPHSTPQVSTLTIIELWESRSLLFLLHPFVTMRTMQLNGKGLRFWACSVSMFVLAYQVEGTHCTVSHSVDIVVGHMYFRLVLLLAH